MTRVRGVLRGLLLACLSVAVLGGCDRGRTSSTLPAADLVLRGARVYTVSSAAPWAQAVAIRDGQFVYVGDDEGVTTHVGRATEVLELNGRLVLPGFHDLHVHVLEAGLNLELCELSPEVDLATYERDLGECAADQRGEVWVRAAGMSLTVLDEAEPPVHVLDRAVPDRPVLVLDDLGHAAFANHRGLELAGIAPDAADPPGGIYHRVPATGRLSGALLENAQQRLRDVAVVSADELYEALLVGLEELARNGVTSVSDAGGYWTRGHPEAWQRALAEQELTVRASNALYLFPDRDFEAQVSAFEQRFSNDPESLLRFDTAKIYVDGILSLGTARLIDAYDEPLDPDHPSGFSYFERETLDAYGRELQRIGYRLHFHAVGDGAVRRALDVVERLGAGSTDVATRGHRTTHNYLVDASDLPRFRALGVIADLQLGEQSSSEAYAESLRPLIGARADRLLPVRDLLAADAPTVLSSDWDADLLSPFGIIERSLTRSRQALPDVQTAVRLLTLSAAEALGQDRRVGSIEVGKLADLVVADRDIFTIAPEQIGETRVLMTLLEGKAIFRAPGVSFGG